MDFKATPKFRLGTMVRFKKVRPDGVSAGKILAIDARVGIHTEDRLITYTYMIEPEHMIGYEHDDEIHGVYEDDLTVGKCGCCGR